MHDPMTEWILAAKKSEIPEGTGLLFRHHGLEIALFRIQEEIYAMDAVCPHAGGPLAQGAVYGEEVMCPWHGWEFNVKTGSCSFDSGIRQKTYAVKEENGHIFLKID